jgi:alpha-beta hydrolase superfamily lysophospholipase
MGHTPQTAMATQALDWSPDVALPGFSATTLTFPDDYEGRVIATLVKRAAPVASQNAVLYIHGFVDYFFQTHLADEFNMHGFNFYALDLRKYGRSLLPSQHPNFCKSLSEYYTEISAAIRIITDMDENTFLLVNGHSTGCLTASLYAHEGEHKNRINALFLNSPFFELNASPVERLAADLLGHLGKIVPYQSLNVSVSRFYGPSIHKDHYGEWAFDKRWKPMEGFPPFYGWLRAIRAGQKRVQAGLNLAIPVLVMHSDKSDGGKEWREGYRVADIVLNVAHMKQYGPGLGPKVKLVEIKDGLHDLTLSRKDVRERVFQELFAWTEQI